MNKILLSIVVAISTATFCNRIYAQDETSLSNLQLSFEVDVNSAELLASTANYGNSALEVLVWANNAVDDLCGYFNGSWADVGITLYCTFGGDPYTCTTHKVIKAMCAVNGAVKLYIEGTNIPEAIKQTLLATSTIYNLTKIDNRKYKISK
ncbi:MAG: hypothetical protein J1E38_02450 [Paramuribaculum sp.]|nr:hypothetical protein [Paramuribaculum sp.]